MLGPSVLGLGMRMGMSGDGTSWKELGPWKDDTDIFVCCSIDRENFEDERWMV